MARYENRILNQLVDTYENSLLSKGKNRRTIHIEMPFTRKNIPEYFNESSMEYEMIHTVMKALETKGFLEIIWKDGKTDHLIRKVRLNTEKMEQIYAYLGREPKTLQEDRNLKLRAEYTAAPAAARKNGALASSSPVTVSFARFLLERIEKHLSVKEYIDLKNPEETRGLLEAVRCVEQNDKTCYIREFSAWNFQDTKYFEQIQPRVIKIFRRFCSAYEDMDAAEILAEYGIYHTPNYVYIKGNATIFVKDTQMDLSLLRQGLGLSGEDLPDISFSQLSHIEKVITIENLTSFFRWQEPKSLIIYLGGYHNGIRRELLHKIYQKIPGAVYCHFGDIDAGGFAIWKDLREKTGIPFQRYHMDIATLKQYEGYGRSLTDSDRIRLTRMLEEPELRELIAYMLERGVKLEQECVECEEKGITHSGIRE